MLTENILAALAMLPCPAIFLGEELWLNKAMRELVTSEEASALFPVGENARFVVLRGRQFAVLHMEEETRALLLMEQFSHEEDDDRADALEMRLRNVLASAVLAAGLLGREVPAGKGKSYLAELKKNIAQVERVINDIHTAHLKGIGGMRLYDVEAGTRELFDKVNYYLPDEKKVEYRVDEGEVYFRCEASLVEAMLLDLAVELLARGSREGRVSLAVTPGERVTFAFTATDLGEFRGELESMLFEKAGEGSGFEAARRVVRLHEGSLYVKMQGETGAVVTVTLPRRDDKAEVYQPEGKYQGYDYVRMMLSDILERDAFLDGAGRG